MKDNDDGTKTIERKVKLSHSRTPRSWEGHAEEHSKTLWPERFVGNFVPRSIGCFVSRTIFLKFI